MAALAERLLFVVDVSAEAAAPCLPGVSRLQAALHAIGLIMLSRVNPGHRYALAVLRDRAELVTSTFAESLAPAQLTALVPEAPYGPFSLTSLAEVYAQALALEDAAAAAASSSSSAAAGGGERRRGGQEQRGRIILFYMRGHVPPAPLPAHCTTPGVPVDALFIHGGTADASADAEPGGGSDAASRARASTQAVWTALETQLDALSLAADPPHSAYIFESSGANVRKVLGHAALLAAHPALRPPQAAVTAPLDLAALLPLPG
jgi:hypothetical protein